MMGEGGERLYPWDLDNLAAELGDVLRRRDELSLEAASIAGVLADYQYGETQGAASTGEWMRHEFKLGSQQAYDLVNVGLEMGSLESSTEAAFEHEIGFQHLAVMARAKRQLGDKRFHEEHLLAEAKEVSVGKLWHRCQELRHATDPEGMEREERDSFAERALRLNQQPDGRVTLSGIYDPVSGAAIQAALEPLAKKCGQHDERNREQRVADALVEVCNQAMGQGSKSKRRPQLNVTATAGTLYQIPDSPAASTDYRALLTGVTVKRIACDCSVGRYVFGTDSVLLDVGRGSRTISPSQRRALMQRDQHCRWPGCTRPGSWCEGHHVIHWIEGGPTNLDNLVLLCWRHHWMVHEGRWHLFLDDEDKVHVLKPPLDLMAPPRGPADPIAA